MKTNWTYTTPGIPDDMFIRGDIPMTKEEVRIITIGKLRINRDDIIVDIGGGTGSLSIEAALMAKLGKVYTVEKNDLGIELIKKNTERFGLNNIYPIKGRAPEILDNVPRVNRAIIGGTGGKIDGIFHWLDNNLASNGRVVMNAITLENAYKGIQSFKERGYIDIDITQASISKGKSIGGLTMMQGQNPIYIISGAKG